MTTVVLTQQLEPDARAAVQSFLHHDARALVIVGAPLALSRRLERAGFVQRDGMLVLPRIANPVRRPR